MSQPKNVLISLRQAKKSYRLGEVKVHALKGIDLEIYQGEFVTILGASGSGKSTLLNLIGGMDQATSGDIIVNNINLSQASEKILSKYRREEVGFVFQFYNLIPDLTAGENISLAASLSGQSTEIEEVLNQIGLLDKKNAFPSHLSGGEQQRISIGRAIVKQPKLLLCDEPTGALDYQTGKMILQLIEEIYQKTGTTVIMVTHNSTIGAMANRVIKMKSGEVIEVIENKDPLPAERIEW